MLITVNVVLIVINVLLEKCLKTDCHTTDKREIKTIVFQNIFCSPFSKHLNLCIKICQYLDMKSKTKLTLDFEYI